jgi:hypothetical protein
MLKNITFIILLASILAWARFSFKASQVNNIESHISITNEIIKAYGKDDPILRSNILLVLSAQEAGKSIELNEILINYIERILEISKKSTEA